MGVIGESGCRRGVDLTTASTADGPRARHVAPQVALLLFCFLRSSHGESRVAAVGVLLCVCVCVVQNQLGELEQDDEDMAHPV